VWPGRHNLRGFAGGCVVIAQGGAVCLRRKYGGFDAEFRRAAAAARFARAAAQRAIGRAAGSATIPPAGCTFAPEVGRMFSTGRAVARRSLIDSRGREGS